mmetsp:Transcript_109772/g.316022  ORF Transcript_109772/g.316022 Transcript_109772/m.316022 type:complete len:236 (-) Transcript_109772:704-1411(-)
MPRALAAASTAALATVGPQREAGAFASKPRRMSWRSVGSSAKPGVSSIANSSRMRRRISARCSGSCCCRARSKSRRASYQVGHWPRSNSAATKPAAQASFSGPVITPPCISGACRKTEPELSDAGPACMASSTSSSPPPDCRSCALPKSVMKARPSLSKMFRGPNLPWTMPALARPARPCKRSTAIGKLSFRGSVEPAPKPTPSARRASSCLARKSSKRSSRSMSAAAIKMNVLD